MILGGGPAGIASAIWCLDMGLTHVVLEPSDKIGGQLNWTFNSITNYPGITASNGSEMKEYFCRHAEKLGVNLQLNVGSYEIDLAGKRIELNGRSGKKYCFKTLVIATGVRRRKLGVPGEDEFAGRGIMASGVGEAEKTKGKRVVIVGGGDAALENAVELSNNALQVTVVNRSSSFRARRDFLDKARKIKNIEILEDTIVTGFYGNEELSSVEICSVNGGNKGSIASDLVLIRIGVLPNSELFAGAVAMDESGFIRTDSVGRTNLEGIYAVGDVANPSQMTLSNAVFTASAAIRDIKHHIHL
jgi:thioredoxin reductase (NADPH)